MVTREAVALALKTISPSLLEWHTDHTYSLPTHLFPHILVLREAAESALPSLGTVCETCMGSGISYEDHGQGMVEKLGCPDCQATGIVPPSRLVAEPGFEEQ